MHRFSPLGITAPVAGMVILAAIPTSAVLAGPPQFTEEAATRFPSPNPTEYTNQVTVGDIENDGDLDLIFANGGNFSSAGTPQIQRVYINNGSGVFTDESARVNFTGLCRGVEMGDIENDGDLDLIFVQDFNRQPQLFVNDGAGNFSNVTLAQLPQMDMSSSRAQFGDIDNDGDLDIYITDGGSNRFGCGQYRVWVNDGAGVFTDETAARHPIGNVCNNMDCLFLDIDNDFDLDVKTASTGTNNSRLYRNDGTGVYSLVNTIPSDSSCYSYDAGDIDGDGLLDLVGVNAGSGSTELLLHNDGNAVFSNVSGQISPNQSLDDNDSKFLDYDNDGDLDLLIARLGSGGERLYENDGAGNFTQTAGVVPVLTDSSLDVVVADLDNNGTLDFVTGNGESGNYQNRIYMNGGPADTLPPTIIDTEDLDDTDDTTGPYVVRALIVDDMSSDRNFFDGGIELRYTVDGADEQGVPMRHSGGQVYRAEIPGVAGGFIDYYVMATDQAGNTGVGTARSFMVDGFLPGDVDGDGVVNTVDLLALIAAWGPCLKGEPCPADFDLDGLVGTADLLALLANWTP